MNGFAEIVKLFVYDKITGLTVKSYLKSFRKTLNMTRADVLEIQRNKLRKLIEHVSVHNPYYRRIFREAGFNPADFHDQSDLKKIPVLTRDTLQNRYQDLISDGFTVNELKRGSSSGSTGTPVVYYQSPKSISAGKAAGQLCWELTPWDFGMKGLHIWGNPRTVNVEWKKFSSRLKARFFNHFKFPAYQLTKQGKFDELYAFCIKENFEFIDGYTNAIYLFAAYLEKNNLKIPPLKCVLTTGENLQDFQVPIIEQNLGKIYDTYGCSEINGIANQCEKCGFYHTIDPHVIVEYGNSLSNDDNARPLIITDLDNYAFPFIRYEIGDTAIAGASHGCDIPFDNFISVSGRTSDLVVLPNGGILSVPSFFGSMLLKQVEGIKQYQIVRDHHDHLSIKLVVDGNYFKKEDDLLVRQSIGDYLKDSIRWDVIYVENLQVSESGKFRLLLDITK